jgi:hypothetical protein
MRTILMKLVLPLTLVTTVLSMLLGTDWASTLAYTGAASAVMSGLSAFGVMPSFSFAVMSSTMITDFKTMFGSYYRPGSQNATRLKKLMNHDDSTWKDQFTYIPLEGDVLEYGIMSHTRVLQAFKPYWSPTGQLSGSPRRLKLQRVKTNIEEIPDFLVNTYLGWLASENGKDPKVDRTTWPFVRWYAEVYLMTQAKQDLYMNEAFCGIWVDPGTNSTPGAAGASIDGLAQKLNLDIDAGNLTPISTGALETDPELFVEQIEDFVEGITDVYRGLNLVINMHDTFVQRFKTGMIDLYNMSYAGVPKDQLATLYKRTNVSLKGHFNMIQSVGGAASEKIWCSPKDNMIRAGRTGGADEGGMHKVETIDYTLKFFNDWHVAYDYWDPRIVFTNDVETL